jgi:hypothetical protein
MGPYHIFAGVVQPNKRMLKNFTYDEAGLLYIILIVGDPISNICL